MANKVRAQKAATTKGKKVVAGGVKANPKQQFSKTSAMKSNGQSPKKSKKKKMTKSSNNKKRPRDQDTEVGEEDDFERREVEKRKKRAKMVEASKTAETQLEVFVEAHDVILVVLDARDPQRCRSRSLEHLVRQQSGSGKRIVFVLNKIDLVPRRNAESWIRALSQEYPTVPSIATNTSTSKATGAEELVKILNHYATNAKRCSTITVGITGFASVGRSTLLRSLQHCSQNFSSSSSSSSSKSSTTAIKFTQTPGLIVSRTSGRGPIDMLLRSKILPEEDLVSTTGALVMRCPKQPLMLKYMLPSYDDGEEFLGFLARQQGKVQKGGVPDTAYAARVFLRELSNPDGGMGFCTTATTKGPGANAEEVTEWMKEFGTSAKENVRRVEQLLGADQRLVSLALAPYDFDEDQKEEDEGEKDEEHEEED